MLGTATKLKTARKIELSGAVSGKENFDGNGDINILTTVEELNDSTIISKTDIQGTVKFRKSQNCVYINILATMNANAGGAVTFTIPSEYIPKELVKQINYTGMTEMNLLLRTNGVGALTYSNSNTSSTDEIIQVTYII